MKSVSSFSLQSLSETFLILRRLTGDMNINVYWSLCKVTFNTYPANVEYMVSS